MFYQLLYSIMLFIIYIIIYNYSIADIEREKWDSPKLYLTLKYKLNVLIQKLQYIFLFELSCHFFFFLQTKVFFLAVQVNKEMDKMYKKRCTHLQYFTEAI